MKLAPVGIASVIIAGIATGAAAATERRPSGSELLRAERCAGHYDCDEDGTWATGGDLRQAGGNHVDLQHPSGRDCRPQHVASHTGGACPAAIHIQTSR